MDRYVYPRTVASVS